MKYIFIVCKNEVLSEITNFIIAVVPLLAWYYVMHGIRH